MWCCVILTIELHAGLDASYHGKLAELSGTCNSSLYVRCPRRLVDQLDPALQFSSSQTKLCTGNGTEYLLCTASDGWGFMDEDESLPLANTIPRQDLPIDLNYSRIAVRHILSYAWRLHGHHFTFWYLYQLTAAAEAKLQIFKGRKGRRKHLTLGFGGTAISVCISYPMSKGKSYRIRSSVCLSSIVKINA